MSVFKHAMEFPAHIATSSRRFQVKRKCFFSFIHFLFCNNHHTFNTQSHDIQTRAHRPNGRKLYDDTDKFSHLFLPICEFEARTRTRSELVLIINLCFQMQTQVSPSRRTYVSVFGNFCVKLVQIQSWISVCFYFYFITAKFICFTLFVSLFKLFFFCYCF